MSKLCHACALSPLAHFFWSYPTCTQRPENFLSSPCQASIFLKKKNTFEGWHHVIPLLFICPQKITCLSSESMLTLFLEYWSFLSLISRKSAINSAFSEVGHPKMGFCMDEKQDPTLVKPFLSNSIWKIYTETLWQPQQKQIVFKDLLNSTFRKLQFGLIVPFLSIKRH